MREFNEDAVAVNGAALVGDMGRSEETRSNASRQLFMIADGMGGHACGDVASRTTIASITQNWDRRVGVVDWADVLQVANDDLYDLMAKAPETVGLGATIVGVEISSETLICFNVGDSRAYRFDGNELTLLSVDDVPEPMIAGEHRQSHQITQALGGRRHRASVDPHVRAFPPLRPKESILLCSDGLTDMLSERRIAQVLRRIPDPSLAVQTLFELALRAGGGDNVSIVLVDVIH